MEDELTFSAVMVQMKTFPEVRIGYQAGLWKWKTTGTWSPGHASKRDMLIDLLQQTGILLWEEL